MRIMEHSLDPFVSYFANAITRSQLEAKINRFDYCTVDDSSNLISKAPIDLESWKKCKGITNAPYV